ncbi:unnamed protein product [Rodentolepis nana]|uniref:Mastermind-like protein 3 n=1 Tax=Rodentolepis nana TaxID=102285 RepID=A0A0R3TNT2_RODNA|nr:unnamed protein product [Rodentolepis nana]
MLPLGLASPSFVPPQPAPLGMHYIQGRNGPPPPMIQHQQYMSPPRQMYPPGTSRPNDAKMAGLVPMGNDQQLEAFLSSSTPTFRQLNSAQNIPTLPIASAPSVTLRHQPRPPIGVARGGVPVMTNGNNGSGPMNPSSVSSFSSSPSNGMEFQPQHQQFGRVPNFQQQRSLPLKMSPCPLNGMQPAQWGPGLSQPVDFICTPQPPSKLSPYQNGGGMVFDPSMMDQIVGPEPPPQQQTQGRNVGPAGDTFSFFDQADGLQSTSSMDDSVQSQSQQQASSSQISQLLSPSPNQRSDPNPRSVGTKPVSNIEDALLPDLDLLGSTDGDPGEGSNQTPSCQIFDNDPMNGRDSSSMLFPSSDDLQTVQNIVDAMQESEGDSGCLQKQQQSFCPEANALFLQD